MAARKANSGGMRGALRLASAAMVGLAATSAVFSQAQTFTLPPPEKVPTIVGIDLPLLPGERLVPIGKSGCSQVYFTPRPEQVEELIKLYAKFEWLGQCRFGLAHGKGFLAYQDSLASAFEATFVYGTSLPPVISRAGSRRIDHFSSGHIFSDLSSKKIFTYSSDNGDSKPVTLTQLETNFFIWGSYLVIDGYDPQGNVRKVSIMVEDMSAYCSSAPLPDTLARFKDEVRQTCSRKKADKHMIVRREGSASMSFYNNPAVWAKSCPLYKQANETYCGGKLFREALGKNDAEVEAVMAASPSSRAASVRDLIDRFAPLERALARQLSAKAETGRAKGDE